MAPAFIVLVRGISRYRFCACSQEGRLLNAVVQEFQMSHAFAVEKSETGPEVPVVSLSFDSEIVAFALPYVRRAPHVLDPMVSRSFGHGPQNPFCTLSLKLPDLRSRPFSFCWLTGCLKQERRPTDSHPTPCMFASLAQAGPIGSGSHMQTGA